MTTPPTPEEWAKSLVVAGPATEAGPWYIQLKGAAGPPLLLSPHFNPSVVQGEAEQVQQFLVAVIREARQGAASGQENAP